MHKSAHCTHKGCLDFERTKNSHTSIVVEPKPIFTPSITHGRTKFTRTHTDTHTRDTEIHEILVIMDSSFFSFSVRSQFVRSHTDYVYFFFRSTHFFPVHISALFLSSLNKIDCSSSFSSSSLFSLLRFWIIFQRVKHEHVGKRRRRDEVR